MAKNLRAKIPASDLLVVHDRNTEATTRFIEEANGDGKGANTEVASTPRIVAEKSVRPYPHIPRMSRDHNDEPYFPFTL